MNFFYSGLITNLLDCQKYNFQIYCQYNYTTAPKKLSLQDRQKLDKLLTCIQECYQLLASVPKIQDTISILKKQVYDFFN